MTKIHYKNYLYFNVFESDLTWHAFFFIFPSLFSSFLLTAAFSVVY